MFRLETVTLLKDAVAMSSPDAIHSLIVRAVERLRGTRDRILPWALHALAARLPRAAARSSASPAVLPGLDARLAPMRPLHPPAAINDNPLKGIHEAVERELRARGHLR